MTKIFVGNLAYQTTEAELRSAFERFGKVLSVQMMTDQSTGKSRGFAFIGMPSFDDADEAIVQLNGKYMQGRPLTVNQAREREKPIQNTTPSRWHLV